LFGVGGLTAGVLANTASVIGGAAFLHSSATGGNANGATLCAYDFRIDANTAPQGAAIYADGETVQSLGSYFSSVYFNSNANCDVTPTTASLGGAACSTSPCNEVSDNSALDAQQQPTLGSIIYFDTPGLFGFNRFAMRGNSAGQLISVLDTNVSGNVSMSNCLIADNHTQHELVHEDHADLTISNCTFANNAIDDGYAFFADHGFTLTNSIVWEPGTSTIDYLADDCGGCEFTEHVLSNDISTFPAGSSGIVQTADPLFVDAANADPDKRDYRLTAYVQDGVVTASQAIDAAVPVAGDDRDLDDNPHDQDVPAVTNAFGDRDLGAYEAQPILDRVFADAFGDPISLLH
jgi:hypothetical protein